MSVRRVNTPIIKSVIPENKPKEIDFASLMMGRGKTSPTPEPVQSEISEPFMNNENQSTHAQTAPSMSHTLFELNSQMELQENLSEMKTQKNLSTQSLEPYFFSEAFSNPLSEDQPVELDDHKVSIKKDDKEPSDSAEPLATIEMSSFISLPIILETKSNSENVGSSPVMLNMLRAEQPKKQELNSKSLDKEEPKTPLIKIALDAESTKTLQVKDKIMLAETHHEAAQTELTQPSADKILQHVVSFTDKCLRSETLPKPSPNMVVTAPHHNLTYGALGLDKKAWVVDVQKTILEAKEGPNIDGYKATISLHPAELGQINAEIQIHKGRANLSLFVENEQVKRMMESSMPLLRASFQETAMDLGKVDVFHQSKQEHFEFKEQAKDHQARQDQQTQTQHFQTSKTRDKTLIDQDALIDAYA